MALIAILIGIYKEYLIILFLIIIHELGHFLCAKLFGISTKQIMIYPLGGLCKFEMDISEYPQKELLILIMGPIFQMIAYELLLYVLNDKALIQQVHYGILLFNLLPIYPLDGGRIGNIMINMICSYKKTFKISIIISYLCTIIILFSQTKISINIIIIYCVLMTLIYRESQKEKIYFQKLLIERIIKKYTYKKRKIIRNIKDLYRYRNNLIKENNKLLSERDYIRLKYEKISKNY